MNYMVQTKIWIEKRSSNATKLFKLKVKSSQVTTAPKFQFFSKYKTTLTANSLQDSQSKANIDFA